MRFVIADDLRAPRDFLKGILIGAGHEVVAECRDGSAAITACREHKPDAVVLDVSMVPMSGSLAARAILAEKLVPHVFMASSAAQDAIRIDLEQRGAHFVSKPFRREMLLREIERHTNP